jgi:hypothetical protein
MLHQMQKESVMANPYSETATSTKRQADAAAAPVRPGKPKEPVDIEVHSGSKQIVLKWADVDGASSYNVFYGQEAEFTESTGVKLPNVKSPVIVACTPGVPQFFRVSAVNSAGESGASVEMTGCSHQ